MSIKVVRGLRFPESSCLGLRSSFSRSSFSRHPLELWGAPYSGANEFKCQGDHKWQLKCLPANLAQLEKELYNSPLSLEEKLILHMLSSVKHSSGSYGSASETIDQTIAQCQDKLQKLLFILCSYRASGQTSIELFLSFAPTLCTSRKGAQLNKRSQNVKNTTLDMQSEPWSPHYRFCTNFSCFCLMTRFLWKIWNDMPGV